VNGETGRNGQPGLRSFGLSLSWHVLLALACLAVGVFYSLPYLSHLQALPADDSYFYVGAIRDAGQVGLVDGQIAARPGYPLVGALVSSVSDTSSMIVAAALPITLAVSLGLAGAAYAARSRLRGPGIVVFAGVAALSGLAARLVAGKSENLMILVLLCALLALAVWVPGRGRWVAVGLFSAAAGLTEWPLMLGFLGVVAAAVLACEIVTPWRGAVRPVLLPMLVSSVAGFGVALATVMIGGGGSLTIQHLPIATRYRPRFDNEVSLLWGPLTVGLIALGVLAARRYRSSGDRPIRLLLAMWLVLTGVAALIGAIGAPLPTYRAIVFSLPIALATTAAVFLPQGWFGSRPKVATRVLGLVLSAAVVVLALIPAANMWYQRSWVPISPVQLQQLRMAARYAMSLPEGKQTVVVIHMDAAHYLVNTRFVIHDMLPPDQDGRLLVFMGKPLDALAGRPTPAFVSKNAAIVEALFPPVGRALRNGAAIVTGRDLHSRGFKARTALGTPIFGRGTMTVVRGPTPRGRLPGAPLPSPLLLPRTVGGFAAFAFGVLLLAGIGWSMLVLPGAPALVRTALAPSFGLVAAMLVTLVGERVGSPPGGTTATVELVVILAASAAAAALRLIRVRRASARPPQELREDRTQVPLPSRGAARQG